MKDECITFQRRRKNKGKKGIPLHIYKQVGLMMRLRSARDPQPVRTAQGSLAAQRARRRMSASPLRGRVLRAYADLLRAQRSAFGTDLKARTGALEKTRQEYRQYLNHSFISSLPLFISLFLNMDL